MEKWSFFLSIYFCICLLAACASTGDGAPIPGSTTSEEPQTSGETAQSAEEAVTETFRIVTVESPGHPPLLLAKLDGTAGEVYNFPSGEGIPVTLEWASADEMAAVDRNYQAGSLVEITHDGTILETYPMQFSNVSAIHVLESGFDDRCAMYLDVLEDLWGKDASLNSDLSYIGVDLSKTSLSPAEQSAVAWAFSSRHGATLLVGP